jgi:hypothetical protein
LGEWRYSSIHSVTSALDGGEWSASRPGRFTPRERDPGTHWIGRKNWSISYNCFAMANCHILVNTDYTTLGLFTILQCTLYTICTGPMSFQAL